MGYTEAIGMEICQQNGNEKIHSTNETGRDFKRGRRKEREENEVEGEEEKEQARRRRLKEE